MHSIVLIFGVTASVVAAIAELLIAKELGKRNHMWRAGGLAVLALILLFSIAKYP